MTELKRTLGLVECVFFGVGSILGAGIYVLIGKAAGWSGNLMWLSFLIASLAALLTAFSYAELSAMYPNVGGEYTYAKKAFGEKIGIAVGFILCISGIVSGATVSMGFAGYLKDLIGVSTLIASLGIITLVFFINIVGIKESSIVNIIFTIIEMLGLLLVMYVAYPFLGKVNYMEVSSKGIHGIFVASTLAFFAYLGFEKIIKLVEETKEPTKNIPRALFISIVIATLFYTLIAFCAISVVEYKVLSKSNSPLAEIVGNQMGKIGMLVISVIALFSTANTILSAMMSDSRILFGMSKETTFLKRFSHVSPKRQTPVAALLLVFMLMCCFALIGDIEILAHISNIFIFLTFILINISVIVLRYKEKETDRPYYIPGNIKNIPVVSVLGIAMTFFLFIYNLYSLVQNGITMH